MKYYEFFKFLESKDRFIDVNPNLTPEQKVEIKAFFQKHPNYENRIDWNKAKSLTYEDFSPILALEGKSVSAVKKGAGIQGLTEGHDYILLGSGVFNEEEWNAYQPLTYYASRLIASRFVKPEVEAKWCTAYQQSRAYWDNHAFKNKESFIYLCGESIPTKKVAITASTREMDSDKRNYSYHLESGLNFSIWDANDKKVRILKSLPKEIINLIPKSYENRELVIQLYDEDVKKTEEIKRQEEERKVQEFIKKLTKNPATGRYDCNVEIPKDILKHLIENGKFKIPFGVVNGNFSCSHCPELTSLSGAPEKVGGNFDCAYCRNLASLEGAPEKVEGYFNCEWCSNLTSLKGAPERVKGEFNCIWCSNLTSLKGAPKEVGGVFRCADCHSLTSLKNAPERVGGDFYCSGCDKLTSLIGAPEKVEGNFDCRWCDKKFTEEEVRSICDVHGEVYCS